MRRHPSTRLLAESDDENSGIVYAHGYAFLAEPKYPADFEHFDYVNPDAPKGGRMRIPAMGSWDNFNALSIPGGQMAAGLHPDLPQDNLLHDSLMAKSADEPSTIYGRLAEGISIAEDGSYIAFKIRDHARWHDGKPITSEDVAFSLGVVKKNHPFGVAMFDAVDRVEVQIVRRIA